MGIAALHAGSSAISAPPPITAYSALKATSLLSVQGLTAHLALQVAVHVHPLYAFPAFPITA
jgi:hypothetical protein